MSRFLLLHKPYGILSQFTPEGRWGSLKDLGAFPPDVYAVGRLDADSEGLLLLTDDRRIRHWMLDPDEGHARTYLAQVERIPDEQALHALRNGVMIEGKKTRPAEVRLLEDEPAVHPRPVPIRFRKNVPTAWLEITLREGRNRQVRKMTAAVGHPTLRLIRTAIAHLTIGALAPGEMRELTPAEVTRLMDVAASTHHRRKEVAPPPPAASPKPRRPGQRFVRK